MISWIDLDPRASQAYPTYPTSIKQQKPDHSGFYDLT